MKDIRVGESLWHEWHGDGYEPITSHPKAIYFTQEHVDMDNEIVRRALASTLQRDGIADSLGDGFKLVESATIETGWAGLLAGEKEYIFCDEEGDTEYGDTVENAEPYTWIEL